MDEENSSILTEVKDSIGIITFNRPEQMNAVSLTMLNEIAYQVQTWEYDESIKAIILQTNSSNFATGIDIPELAAELTQQSLALKAWQDEFAKIDNCTKPLIAAVSGYALGIGCDLAMACDIILASDNAQFGYPETSLGMIPAFGGCSKLIKCIGRPKAMEAILTGKAIGAEEADKLGLISRIISLGDLQQEAERIAMRIASQPTQAVMLAKETIRQAENMTLQNALDMESKSCRLAINSRDFQENLTKISGNF